jgi:hypothetical protein
MRRARCMREEPLHPTLVIESLRRRVQSDSIRVARARTEERAFRRLESLGASWAPASYRPLNDARAPERRVARGCPPGLQRRARVARGTRGVERRPVSPRVRRCTRLSPDGRACVRAFARNATVAAPATSDTRGGVSPRARRRAPEDAAPSRAPRRRRAWRRSQARKSRGCRRRRGGASRARARRLKRERSRPLSHPASRCRSCLLDTARHVRSHDTKLRPGSEGARPRCTQTTEAGKPASVSTGTGLLVQASGPSSARMSASERIPTSRSPSSTTSRRSS